MFLTSFIHRAELFDMTGRWLCNRLEPGDGLRLTQILICDGFVLGDTLERVIRHLLTFVSDGEFSDRRIRCKGELREMLCGNGNGSSSRVKDLIHHYRSNPDFFYREAPINGAVWVDREGHLIGLHRIKRPRRIAEKANRYVANWIFNIVRSRARRMAEERAERLGVPLDRLLTSPEEMAREFAGAEEAIAASFREGRVEFDQASMTINDVGGIKVVADRKKLSSLESELDKDSSVRIVERESYQGDYNATSLILEVSWNPASSCRRFTESQTWERYRGRGISDEVLKKGLEPFIQDAASTLSIELILSTFPDMMESELGVSIHEGRILVQRGQKTYNGNIPMNVEFLIEYLLASGLSPEVDIPELPIKLWGRYLPDTISSHIRRLYHLPEGETLY
jgi:hypothetical protein